MGLSDELRDPWGLLVGGVSGGLAWALVGGPVGVAAGLGVGAVVYAAKAVTGLMTDRGAPRPRESTIPRPPRGSAASYWLERAEGAVHALDGLATTAPGGPSGEAVRSAAADAGRTLAELARIGAQVVAVEAAEARVDVQGLREEADRLDARAAGAASPALANEVRRAAAAVRDRLAVAQRLDDARSTLVARMEATALGLESLVARLAEVLALTATTGGVETGAAEIAEIATELDGLRAGLAETEALSRRVLGTTVAEEEPG